MVNMTSETRPLRDRLGLLPDWCNPQRWLQSLEINKGPFFEGATDFNRACGKGHVSDKKFLLALTCHYAEQPEAARVRGQEFLAESVEFFFGDWRQTYVAPTGQVDPKWWQEQLEWMSPFEAGLLWGSVLGQWDYLQRLGAFPSPEGRVTTDRSAQERDLLVAIAAVIRQAPAEEVTARLDQAAAGRNKACKLAVDILRGGLARDLQHLQIAVTAYLKHYRANEFPQEMMASKVSILGTFFVHWAEKQGLAVVVLPKYLDHIVRLP